LLVAELDRVIVGFIDRWDLPDFAHGGKLSYIENLCVIPQFRRKGVGDVLINKPAISMYKKHGFLKRSLQLEIEL